MNFKKIAIATASVALLIGSSVPAFASSNHDNDHNNGGTTNVASITNGSTAYASTGVVTQTGGSNTARTGNARANATAGVVANNQVGCNCDTNNVNNVANVTNGAGAQAYTDGVVQTTGSSRGGDSHSNNNDEHNGNGGNGTNSATTGNARSSARSWVLVNNQVSGL